MKALAKAILCLYPLAHRRRYRAEMEALLDESEVRISTLFDLLRGAALARLRPLPGLAAGLRVRAGASLAIQLAVMALATTIAALTTYRTTPRAAPRS
jgi:hypothetical protein